MCQNCQKADVKNLLNTKKEENKREGRLGAKPGYRKRNMSQKEEEEEEEEEKEKKEK
jgi:hypothetical protein